MEVSAPLAFSATLARRDFYALRAMDLVDGIVHLEPGSVLRETSVGEAGVVVTARMGHGTGDVAGLVVPCDALGLDMPHDTPAKPPSGGGERTWAPRGKRVTFRASPLAGAAVALEFSGRVGGIFEEVDARGRFRQLVFPTAYGWLLGWVDSNELVRTTPDDSRVGIYGPALGTAPPGGYVGPATVLAGTIVYARSGGKGAWATVPEDVVLEIVAAKDATWVQLTGTRVVSRDHFSMFARGVQAWVPASAVQVPAPRR